MPIPELQSLCAELRRRLWDDYEITDRVLVHSELTAVSKDAPGGAPRDLPPPTHGAIVRRLLDASDPVAVATEKAASDLDRLGAQPGARVRERDLSLALGKHLDGSVERRLHVPNWDPQPGNVDLFTTGEDGLPSIVIEAKLKSDNSIFECLWDMAKVLSLATDESIQAYLVTGTTVANWQKPIACAELFVTGRHQLVGEIERHADWWDKYILGDSTGRPSSVAETMDIELVGAIQLPLGGTEWELRAIRLSDADPDRWRPFSDGHPVALP